MAGSWLLVVVSWLVMGGCMGLVRESAVKHFKYAKCDKAGWITTTIGVALGTAALVALLVA